MGSTDCPNPPSFEQPAEVDVSFTAEPASRATPASSEAVGERYSFRFSVSPVSQSSKSPPDGANL